MLSDLFGEGDDLSSVEDRREGDDSDEPRPVIAALLPGDTISIAGVECELQCVGERVNYGDEGVYRLGIPPSAFGTVASLYVDRDPYRLDFCRGRVYDVDPDEVEVVDGGEDSV